MNGKFQQLKTCGKNFTFEKFCDEKIISLRLADWTTFWPIPNFQFGSHFDLFFNGREFRFQMAFKIITILNWNSIQPSKIGTCLGFKPLLHFKSVQKLDLCPSFEYWTSPVFRSPLYTCHTCQKQKDITGRFVQVNLHDGDHWRVLLKK